MGFLKFILVTILVIYFIRLVAPFVLRWIFKAFFKKMAKNGQFYGGSFQNGQYRSYQQQEKSSRKASGNVNIDYIPEEPDRKEFRGGQYVDYEEVK
ncbi:MAG: DUF4834 family protein [Hymenobacteraceae bacterium]|nr:DUF4834 family protein [Hymenobacteraceae bacterium]MDX5395537.1 DUF4834 family protein [Hymenobacteraceae bacterium]MDX5511591.1 DUF4834 family protein [Hymenobacteraceae bacterium]